MSSSEADHTTTASPGVRRATRSHPLARTRARTRRASVTATAAAMLLLAGCFDQQEGSLGLGEQAFGEVRTDLSCDQLTELAQAQLAWAVETMAMDTDPMLRSETPEFAESDAAAPGDEGSSPLAGAAPPTTAAGDQASAGEVVAGTNVREVGVDESDIVKTDGERIVSVQDGVLHVVGLDGTPALDGTLPIGGADGYAGVELFLRGDEALVIVDSYRGDIIVEDVAPTDLDGAAEGSSGEGDAVVEPEPTDTTVPDTTTTAAPDTTAPQTTTTVPETTVPETTTTVPETTVPETTTTLAPPEPPPFAGVTLVRVDLTDPSRPTEIERTTVEGSLVAARMVDGTARIVVRSTPGVMNDIWAADGTAEVQQIIREVDAEDLLPRVASGEEVSSLGGCADVAVLPVSTTELDAPGEHRYVGDPTTVSVLTVGDTLTDLAPTTVEGMADIVYASPTALYVTSNDWTGSTAATAVHRFDTATDGPAAYTGSGTVPGTVLDDYSLSEDDGDLRVVTTVDTFEPMEEETPEDPESDVTVVTPSGPEDIVAPDDLDIVLPSTEGRLTVLRPDDSGALEELSHVEDLGEGERVQSVRYVGDLAYVVTFRQTDPLYAIDLSDHTAPKVLGELKVTGFSEYLHPVGDGLLLGLGREADEDGVDEGFKVSLFDVTDPTAPVELDKIVIPEGWSMVADDPHAFTWDPIAGHAIFPLMRTMSFECDPGAVCTYPDVDYNPTQGALVVAVEDGGLEEVAELRHADDPSAGQPEILRSLVVDRDLWTLSGVGLGLSDADAPTTVELIEF